MYRSLYVIRKLITPLCMHTYTDVLDCARYFLVNMFLSNLSRSRTFNDTIHANLVESAPWRSKRIAFFSLISLHRPVSLLVLGTRVRRVKHNSCQLYNGTKQTEVTCRRLVRGGSTPRPPCCIHRKLFYLAPPLHGAGLTSFAARN